MALLTLLTVKKNVKDDVKSELIKELAHWTYRFIATVAVSLLHFSFIGSSVTIYSMHFLKKELKI